MADMTDIQVKAVLEDAVRVRKEKVDRLKIELAQDLEAGNSARRIISHATTSHERALAALRGMEGER